MKKIVDIKKVSFNYKRQNRLFSDLNLELYTGQINGLLGKNGEGKSTMLKLLSGLLFPKHGKIYVNNFNPKFRHPNLLKDLFFLPEEIQDTMLSIKAYEMVYAPFYPDFSSTKFYNYLNEFTVDSATPSISDLSYGQRKKFFIAFGLATNAKLILLDEPTNGLDIPSKRQFRRMVATTIDQKCCIVISTHQVLDLDELIDNIIILDGHEIIFNEKSEVITQKLFFQSTEKKDTDKDVIYSEETLNGYNQIKKNTKNEKSKMDIEMLFNAVVSHHSQITNLFKS